MTRKANGLMAVLQAVLFCQALIAGPSAKGSFYKEEELSGDVALNGGKFFIATIFGPTGLNGWILDDKLVVGEVDKGSPADGVIEVNDVICAVNGKPFGENPLKVLGEQIVVSEASGALELSIRRRGTLFAKTLALAKLPPLAATWPYDCAKSKQIILNAAKYLSNNQNPDGGFDGIATIGFAMSGLTWLASDDPQYLQNCRRMIDWYDTNHMAADKDPTFAWGLGYSGVFIAEYYLKTGDRSVLKALKKVSDRIVESQDPRGGWTHGVPGSSLYGQGGIMNPPSAGCWLALELCEQAGLSNKKALEKVRHFLMRFVDNGTLPYGENHPEFNGSGNSKDELACLALYVKGDQKSAELFGRLATDFYEHRTGGHTGGFLGFAWGNIAGSHNPDRADYRRSLDYWNWLLHVGRRWDGGFHLPPNVTGETYFYLGPILNIGASLVYGVPNKSLRIFGKPESVFGVVKLTGELKKGLEQYQALKFSEVRKTVSDKSEFGRQLLQAANMKEQDIALSLKTAKAALAAMNPITARATAATLNAMCEGRLTECKELIKQADGGTYASVMDAAREYEDNRWQVYTLPAARKTIEKIASAQNSGMYKQVAQNLLNTSPDDSKWHCFTGVIYGKYWSSKETNDVALAMIKRLANMRAGNWMVWHPANWLREKGYLKDNFLTEWKAVLPCSELNAGKDAREFHYYGAIAGKPNPPNDWTSPGFDDSQWTNAVGPMSNAADSKFKPAPGAQCHYFRIPFDATATNFAEWKLYIKRAGGNTTAVVYLNGNCIAWADPGRAPWSPVTLNTNALRFLKKGKNVLAVRVRDAWQMFDVGIYAKEVK